MATHTYLETLATQLDRITRSLGQQGCQQSCTCEQAAQQLVTITQSASQHISTLTEALEWQLPFKIGKLTAVVINKGHSLLAWLTATTALGRVVADDLPATDNTDNMPQHEHLVQLLLQLARSGVLHALMAVQATILSAHEHGIFSRPVADVLNQWKADPHAYNDACQELQGLQTSIVLQAAWADSLLCIWPEKVLSSAMIAPLLLRGYAVYSEVWHTLSMYGAAQLEGLPGDQPLWDPEAAAAAMQCAARVMQPMTSVPSGRVQPCLQQLQAYWQSGCAGELITPLQVLVIYGGQLLQHVLQRKPQKASSAPGSSGSAIVECSSQGSCILASTISGYNSRWFFALQWQDLGLPAAWQHKIRNMLAGFVSANTAQQDGMLPSDAGKSAMHTVPHNTCSESSSSDDSHCSSSTGTQSSSSSSSSSSRNCLSIIPECMAAVHGAAAMLRPVYSCTLDGCLRSTTFMCISDPLAIAGVRMCCGSPSRT